MNMTVVTLTIKYGSILPLRISKRLGASHHVL